MGPIQPHLYMLLQQWVLLPDKIIWQQNNTQWRWNKKLAYKRSTVQIHKKKCTQNIQVICDGLIPFHLKWEWDKVSNNRTELSPLFQPPPLHSLWVSTHHGLLSAAVAFHPRSEWTCRSHAPQSNPTSSCSKQSESYRGHNSSLSVFFQARHVWVCSEDSGLWTWMYTPTFINSHSLKDNDDMNKAASTLRTKMLFCFFMSHFHFLVNQKTGLCMERSVTMLPVSLILNM